VERLVDAAVAHALKPWRREEPRRQAMEHAVNGLPLSMGWNFKPEPG
jgi:hypothetical protein